MLELLLITLSVLQILSMRLVYTKNGKAGGFDGIVREHFIYSHPALVVCLMLLFNIMCTVYTLFCSR